MSILTAFLATLGGVDPVIDVQAGTYGNPIPGQAGLYRLESDGDVIVGAGSDQGDWVTPKASAPGAYEVRATLNSGTLASGTTGTWQALTTTRSWTCAFDGTANLTIEIRDGSAVVQDSGTVIINGGGGI